MRLHEVIDPMPHPRGYRVTVHGRLITIEAHSLYDFLTQLRAALIPDDEDNFLAGGPFHIKAQPEALPTTSVGNRDLPTTFLRKKNAVHALKASRGGIVRAICGNLLSPDQTTTASQGEFFGDDGCRRCKMVYEARSRWKQ